MCLFVETHYAECKHTCFELYVFCREILRQLDRINDPEQRERYDLPFDPDCAVCEPYTIVSGPSMLWPGGNYVSTILESNITHRTTDLVDCCPICCVKRDW